MWAGTWGGGLSRYDGKAWTQYTVAEGLPGNHVFMLHIDPKGVMWVGTNNGLAKMQDGKFKVLTTQDGLFNNAVFSMTTARAVAGVHGAHPAAAQRLGRRHAGHRAPAFVDVDAQAVRIGLEDAHRRGARQLAKACLAACHGTRRLTENQ